MLRTEALTKLAAGGNKKVIVTYPEALFEKVVKRLHFLPISFISSPVTAGCRRVAAEIC
jgi:hypothetical protein